MPDLPVDEAGEWIERAAAHGLETVFLAAPGTIAAAPGGHRRRQPRVRVLRGHVRRDGRASELAATARELVERLRPLTDTPLLVGVGIGTPDQAAAACRFADGVIVGSALVARLVAGDPEGALDLARAFRERIPTHG